MFPLKKCLPYDGGNKCLINVSNHGGNKCFH
jgi:hypothetical protein